MSIFNEDDVRGPRDALLSDLTKAMQLLDAYEDATGGSAPQSNITQALRCIESAKGIVENDPDIVWPEP